MRPSSSQTLGGNLKYILRQPICRHYHLQLCLQTQQTYTTALIYSSSQVTLIMATDFNPRKDWTKRLNEAKEPWNAQGKIQDLFAFIAWTIYLG